MTTDDLSARVAELEAETIALRYFLRQLVATLGYVPMLTGGDAAVGWLRQNVNRRPHVAMPVGMEDL